MLVTDLLRLLLLVKFNQDGRCLVKHKQQSGIGKDKFKRDKTGEKRNKWHSKERQRLWLTQFASQIESQRLVRYVVKSIRLLMIGDSEY